MFLTTLNDTVWAQVDFKVVEDTIDLVYHPLEKHFELAQNNLIIKKGSKEMAATFGDPSRVLYRHVGISLQNDQNNAVIYRGLPPEYMRWSIDGAEVVSPNHLANAGRITDQVSPSAGGVLGIPFDVINSLNFYGNPYNNKMFSSLSGVTDFNFDSRSDNFIKLGFLGMEAGIQTEGKLETKAHLRYSTIGLLSDLGVDFDGEAIKFYDAFLRTKLSDKVSVLFSGGISTNDKSMLSDSSEIGDIKDYQQISFDSKFFMTGVNYKSTNQSHSMYFSRKKSERMSSLDPGIDIPYYTSSSRDVSDHYVVSYYGNRKFVSNAGVFNLGAGFTKLDNGVDGPIYSSVSSTVVRLLGRYESQVDLAGFKFYYSPGLTLNFMDNYAVYKFVVEPSLNFSLSKGLSKIEFNFSRKSRSERIRNAIRTINPTITNQAYSIAYKYRSDDSGLNCMLRTYIMKLKSDTYPFAVEHLENHEPLIEYLYASGLMNDFVLDPFNPRLTDGLRSKGIEIAVNKKWSNGWNSHANFSYMDVKYNRDDYLFNPDLNYLFNFVVSKEWTLKKGTRFNINFAFHYRDGANSVAFNPEDSIFENAVLNDYYRFDARLQWVKKRTTITLDIQNLSSRANDAYLKYNILKKQMEIEKQLTLIPVFSWKRVF